MGSEGLEERLAYGRSKRDVVSRRAQSQHFPKERKFDPVDVIIASGHGRLPQLLPLKYARMAVSPFAFFRGSVAIMAADLALKPHSDLRVQLCGDAHVQNLGSFAAPDGKLIFDLNDFDETIRGPWEWDVKRMAVSLILAGRESGHTNPQCHAVVEDFVGSYFRSIDQFSKQPILQMARHQIHREGRIRPVSAALRQSARARPVDLMEKLTEKDTHGRPRFRNARPLSWRITGKLAKEVLGSLKQYRERLLPERRRLFDRFVPIDTGFKVVGTGSVGMRDYVVLFEGNGASDPLFLQIKQEVRSVYADYLGSDDHGHEGHRVADGQRAIQPNSDLLLGWTSFNGHDFLVRQLNDHKGSIDLKNLRGEGLKSLAVIAGEILARGHARSGDSVAIRGYCGSNGVKIAHSIAAFAGLYADQTEKDYRVFLTAIKKKKIKIAASV